MTVELNPRLISMCCVLCVQIGHSIRSCDVPSLFRDFGIVVINAADTEVGFLV